MYQRNQAVKKRDSNKTISLLSSMALHKVYEYFEAFVKFPLHQEYALHPCVNIVFLSDGSFSPEKNKFIIRAEVTPEYKRRVINRKVIRQSSSERLEINCDRIERDALDNIFSNQFEDRKHEEYVHNGNSIDNKSRYVSMIMDLHFCCLFLHFMGSLYYKT